MITKRSSANNLIKKIGRICVLFLFPLIGSAIVVLPAYLLKSPNWILSISIYIGQFLFSLYLIHRWYNFSECGIKKYLKFTSLSWGLLFLVIRCSTWVIFLPVTVTFPGWQVVIPELLFFLFINSTTEEIHFRGLLYNGIFKETSRPQVAAIISSVLFGLLHLFLGQPNWIPLFIADGLAWCAIRMRTDSIYPAIVAHALQNLLFTYILLVPTDLSYQTEMVYTIMAIIADLLFFIFATMKLRPKMNFRKG
ncbi:MAG TPA: hypothetical protein DCF68_03985 [Cyanothece sp. UBA12306]|nr:hypothetical protein [Cyanothece sp. UBA12306]